jgi:hypothetical protein
MSISIIFNSGYFDFSRTCTAERFRILKIIMLKSKFDFGFNCKMVLLYVILTFNYLYKSKLISKLQIMHIFGHNKRFRTILLIRSVSNFDFNMKVFDVQSRVQFKKSKSTEIKYASNDHTQRLGKISAFLNFEKKNVPP